MDEQKVIDLFNEGYSIDYIIGYMLIECNKNTKQWDSYRHIWHIHKPNYTRQDITRYVYNILYQEHMKKLKEGDRV